MTTKAERLEKRAAKRAEREDWSDCEDENRDEGARFYAQSGRAARAELRQDAIEQRGSIWEWKHKTFARRRGAHLLRENEEWRRPSHAIPPAVKRRHASKLRRKNAQAVEVAMLLERCRARVTLEDLRIFRTFWNVGAENVRAFEKLVHEDQSGGGFAVRLELLRQPLRQRSGVSRGGDGFVVSLDRFRAAPSDWPTHIPWPGVKPC